VQLRSELETSALSHDPHVVAAYLKDRLVHDRITPGFFESMMGAISKTLESKQAFSVPVQFLIPEADRIVDPATTLNYAERLIAPAKGIEVYSNFFHESFNELGKERAFSDLSRWVNQYKG
jgi:alpha-beta hydrolase superfamily lysophospholipase